MPSTAKFSLLPGSGRHFLLLQLLVLLTSVLLVHGQDDLLPTAKLSTLWVNNSTNLHTTLDGHVGGLDRSIIRHILRYNPTAELTFACGFFSNPALDAFLLAIYVIHTADKTTPQYWSNAQLVWSANRDHLVGENAVLDFTAGGNLVLRDANGTVVWSTNTAGKGVVGANITATGNLVLFDEENEVVWQSFDHPTDVLVLGQTLKEGQRLTANRNLTDWARGQFYLTFNSDDLYAYVDSSPPQPYYNFFNHSRQKNYSAYLEYRNGSLELITDQSTAALDRLTLPNVTVPSDQFLRLESDGHLRTYQWTPLEGWKVVFDVFQLGYCGYPTVCGEYGICDGDKCSCAMNYWKPIDSEQPSLGCSPVNPFSCESTQNDDQFPDLNNVSYFIPADSIDRTFEDQMDEAECRRRCSANCSCKAAVFHYSTAYCLLLSKVFSMNKFHTYEQNHRSYIYVKIQVKQIDQASKSSTRVSTLVGALLGAAFSLSFFILAGAHIIVRLRRKKYAEEAATDEDFRQVAGMPTRFSLEELRSATENFSKKIGQGGFGSVYEGKIGDERVAVKRLDGFGQGKKEFLAEVESIGTVHHINLVRLIGFCAEKSHRLLVYEYMCNGSLDKWIFDKSRVASLDWRTRRKIIAGTAKGLSYLHEECRQTIAHLDIKPQNILLNDGFVAKISDFGMSKLIGREQSQVMTRMRGTLGYLAPEWLTSMITEKVDVYSFGVVVVEIVCGRKNLDYSRSEGSFHLLTLLLEKIESDRLVEIVGDQSDDMEMHWEEVTEMIRLAIWCLQRDGGRRPSMSTVVKVLEGVASVAEEDLDYDLFGASLLAPKKAAGDDHRGRYSPVRTPTLLSGPR